MATDDEPGSNRALRRTTLILDTFDGAELLTASEIAERSGIPSSTVHRFALSLVEYGFLSRLPSGAFSLGPRSTSTTRLERMAPAILEQLSRTTGHSAQLWVPVGDELLCVAGAEGSTELRVVVPVGAQRPLLDGPVGHIFGASTDALTAVVARGWYEDGGEQASDLVSVCAPVWRDGAVEAVLCVTLPRSRAAGRPGDDFGDAVASSARTLSEYSGQSERRSGS